MSIELSCKIPDSNDYLTIAVRFSGGYDRGTGVQICTGIKQILKYQFYPAYLEGSIDPQNRTISDILVDWLNDGFEDQSYNLDPKSFLVSRAFTDLRGAFDRFSRITSHK